MFLIVHAILCRRCSPTTTVCVSAGVQTGPDGQYLFLPSQIHLQTLFEAPVSAHSVHDRNQRRSFLFGMADRLPGAPYRREVEQTFRLAHSIQLFLNSLPQPVKPTTVTQDSDSEAACPRLLCAALPVLENVAGFDPRTYLLQQQQQQQQQSSSTSTIDSILADARRLPLVRRWQIADWLTTCIRDYSEPLPFADTDADAEAEAGDADENNEASAEGGAGNSRSLSAVSLLTATQLTRVSDCQWCENMLVLAHVHVQVCKHVCFFLYVIVCKCVYSYVKMRLMHVWFFLKKNISCLHSVCK